MLTMLKMSVLLVAKPLLHDASAWLDGPTCSTAFPGLMTAYSEA